MPIIPKIIVLFFALTGYAAEAVVQPDQKSLSKTFLRQVNLQLTESTPKVDIVVYGNPKVGFFETVKFSQNGSKLSFPMLPPSYEQRIRFYAGYKQGDGGYKYKRIGAETFKSPVPQIYKKLAGKVEHGQFSSPFFLVNGALPRQKLVNPRFMTKDPDYFQKDKYRFTFIMVLNRLGEIVWLHVPSIDDTYFSSYVSAKRVADGVYGILFGKRAGYFEAVAANGDVLRSFSSQEAKDPFPMHHDFQIADADTMFAISSKAGKLKKWGLSGGQPATFLADTLVKIDMDSGRAEEKFDFLNHYNPARDSFWTGDDPDDKKFVLWGEPKVDFDFLHINALSYVKDGPHKGFLVSLRNISKVVLIDETFSKIKWTFGSERRDTFYIANESDQFLHQHTPYLIDDRHIVLFDNGREEKSSRVLVYRLNQKQGSAEVVWEYAPKPTLYSKNRSSVHRLGNGNLLAFFVSPAVGGAPQPRVPNVDVLMEIDYTNRTEAAKMVLQFEVLSPGYRAEPLNTIGRETFLGYSLANEPPQNESD